MASEGILVDDVDLIDLETGLAGSCVPRVSVPDATPEEQEHLLDVCPPKLEQKLSLTRRSHDHTIKLNDKDAAGNVLVTLGHDQVVPVRKRIDVVSSDTIKRVRDITKNLEPVISLHISKSGDYVDFGTIPKIFNLEDDGSFEVRQISDAFNFLSEIDDNDELFEHRSHSDYERVTLSSKLALSSASSTDNVSYPLEPTCFIESPGGRCKSKCGTEFDNKAFESSPTSVIDESSKRPTSLAFDFEISRADHTSFKRLRSFNCLTANCDIELWRKKSRNCPYRKSWSAGSSANRLKRAGNVMGRRKRTNSERINDIKSIRKRKLANSDRSASSFGATGSASSGASASSSSSCSEVDWSWVEELEPEPQRHPAPHQQDGHEQQQQQQQQRPPRHRRPSSRRRPPAHRHHPHQRAAAGTQPAAAVAAAAEADERPPTPGGGGGPGRMRRGRAAGRAGEASVAMSVAAAGKSAAGGAPSQLAAAAATTTTTTTTTTRIEDGGGSGPEVRLALAEAQRGARDLADVAGIPAPLVADSVRGSSSSGGGGGGTLPWLRASMRRLRQLRLPDGASALAAAAASASAAPNSLPDIALIAPEILAAQTNDTSGGLLRPSSAPTTAATAAAAATSADAGTTGTSDAAAAAGSAGGSRRGRRRQQQAASSAESTSTCASSGTDTEAVSSSASSASSGTVSPRR